MTRAKRSEVTRRRGDKRPLATSREDLLAFLRRDWALSRRVKDAAIGRWVHDHGSTAAFRLAQMLLDEVWLRRRHEPSDVRGLIRYEEQMRRAGAAGR